jgi:hypothetical protein
MNDQPILITRLESKIEDLHRGWNNAQAIINSNPTSIQEYIQLKEDTSIETGIRYISLEAIAEEYNLYRDDREISELKDLIGRAIDIPPHADVLQSVQTIRDKYRQIYECNGREFDRYERLIEQIAQRYSQENDMSTNPNKDRNNSNFPEQENLDAGNKVNLNHKNTNKQINIVIKVVIGAGTVALITNLSIAGAVGDLIRKTNCGGIQFNILGFQCLPPTTISEHSPKKEKPPKRILLGSKTKRLFRVGEYKIDNSLLEKSFSDFHETNIKSLEDNFERKIVLHIYGSADIVGDTTFNGIRKSRDETCGDEDFNEIKLHKKIPNSSEFDPNLTDAEEIRDNFKNKDLPTLRARWLQCWLKEKARNGKYQHLRTEIFEGAVEKEVDSSYRNVIIEIHEK